MSSAARSLFFCTTAGAALATKPSLASVFSQPASSFWAAAISFSRRAFSAERSTLPSSTTKASTPAVDHSDARGRLLDVGTHDQRGSVRQRLDGRTQALELLDVLGTGAHDHVELGLGAQAITRTRGAGGGNDGAAQLKRALGGLIDILSVVGGLRPLGNHERLGAVQVALGVQVEHARRHVIPDLLGDKRHERVHQANGGVEHKDQVALGLQTALALQAGLGDLDVPVADLIPEELLHAASHVAKGVVLDALGDHLDGLGQAAEHPSVGRRLHDGLAGV